MCRRSARLRLRTQRKRRRSVRWARTLTFAIATVWHNMKEKQAKTQPWWRVYGTFGPRTGARRMFDVESPFTGPAGRVPKILSWCVAPRVFLLSTERVVMGLTVIKRMAWAQCRWVSEWIRCTFRHTCLVHTFHLFCRIVAVETTCYWRLMRLRGHV